jgi:NTP pyrophosphatase (non-canonical NTP hydrolase)
MNVSFDLLAKDLHHTAQDKGFWEPTKRIQEQDAFVFYAKQIAMIHSEATEVLEALRKSKGEREVVEELADIIVRVLDLWAGLDANGVTTSSLEEVFVEKINKNRERPYLHGVKG